MELEKQKDLQLERLTRQVFDLNRNQEALEEDFANVMSGSKNTPRRKLSEEQEEELYQLVKSGKDIVKVKEGHYQVQSLI